MLYYVTRTIGAYVQADSAEEAKDVPIFETMSDVETKVDLITITKQVRNSWHNRKPFCRADRRETLTIKQLLAENDKEHELEQARRAEYWKKERAAEATNERV